MRRHFRLPQAEQPTHQIGALVASELVEALGHVDLLEKIKVPEGFDELTITSLQPPSGF